MRPRYQFPSFSKAQKSLRGPERESTNVSVADRRTSMFWSGNSSLFIDPFYRPIAGGVDCSAVKRKVPALMELTF